jgi:MFS family permease
MSVIIMSLVQSVSAPRSLEQANYRHLVMDIVWFGVALPATARFLQVYAIRLGADANLLTWMASLHGLVLLFAASISGWWLKRYNDPAKANFWPSLGFRLQFLLPAFTPFLPPPFQPIWLVLSLLLPAIPQGIASVTFLVTFRDSVTEKQIPPLLSHRSLALNVCLGLGGVLMGQGLEHGPFPSSYQVMFLIAFGLTLVSFWHVISVRRLPKSDTRPVEKAVETAGPGPWRSPSFLLVAFIVGIIHIGQLAVLPLINLHLMKNLGASEAFLGSEFALAELVSGAVMALFTRQIAERIGTRSMVGLAMIAGSIGLILIALAPSLPLTILGSAISGAAWTAAGVVGAFSLFSEMAPQYDKARYTMAYSQVVFLAIFIGPMIGKLLNSVGLSLVTILLIGAALRLLAGVLTQTHLLEWFGRTFHLAWTTR